MSDTVQQADRSHSGKNSSPEEHEQILAIRAALARKEISQGTREWLVSRLSALECGRNEISSLKYVESLGLELNDTEKTLRGVDFRMPKDKDPEIIIVFVADPNSGRKLPVVCCLWYRCLLELPVECCFRYSWFRKA